MWVGTNRQRTVGIVLARARKAAAISQIELAEKLEKPQSFVSSYENGQRRVDVLEFINIADAIGGDAAALFKEVIMAHNASHKRG